MDNEKRLKEEIQQSKPNNLTTDEELVQSLVKTKNNRDNWYTDELLENITHIQENVKNKEISKLEYIAMLDGIVRKINKIKEKVSNETNLHNK